MKKPVKNLINFIQEMKSFFQKNLSEESGVCWEDESWQGNKTVTGFLTSSNITTLNFTSLKLKLMKGLYLKDERKVIEDEVTITPFYVGFLKSMVVFQYKSASRGVSVIALNRNLLLLKRIYFRLKMQGIEQPVPMNITSEVVEKALDALAEGAKSISTVADQYTAMANIVKTINYLGLVNAPITFENKVRRPSTKSTKSAKQSKTKAFHEALYSELLDEDEHEKFITIATFLNVIAAKQIAESDGEKIMLNLLLLLMITGFRFNEAAVLQTDALKRLEIENKKTVKEFVARGLKPYNLGIQYQGEKGVGIRTHWVEPIAIPLIEQIFESTLKYTESIRSHITRARNTNFNSLIPLELANKKEVELDESVTYVVESWAKSAKSIGHSAKRRATLLVLESKGIIPCRSLSGEKRYALHFYETSEINRYLGIRAKEYRFIDEQDFSLHIKDSKSKFTYKIPYEDALFIMPLGSWTLTKTIIHKTVPSIIDIRMMSNFLGSTGTESFFKKYNLLEDDGTHSKMHTHMPRHHINTFLALSGINDHLQAAMMGRTDITQNEHYQHVALEEQSIASSYSATIERSSKFSVMAQIIEENQIGLNPKFELKESISQNLHTYTTEKDRVGFIGQVFNDNTLDIFDDLKNEVRKLGADSVQSKELLYRHNDLHILNVGSCTRKVELWTCPFAMKCQDGAPCSYFTLTGRLDERSKLKALQETVRASINKLNFGDREENLSHSNLEELLADLSLSESNIERLLNSSNKLEDAKLKISLDRTEILKKPKTLATIFAIEQRKKDS